MASTWCWQGRCRRANGAAWVLHNSRAQQEGSQWDLGLTLRALAPAVTWSLCGWVRVWQPLSVQPGCWALLGFMGRHAIVWQQFFVPAWGGVWEAGSGHSCHEHEVPTQGSGVPTLGGCGHCVGAEGSVPKCWAQGGAGMSLSEDVGAPFSVSPSPSLFPLHLCLPPLPPALCRHLIIYIKLTFAEFTQGSVIVFFHRFCITNHENGILSSLTNF